MLRNMAASLLKHERIHTTDTKAKVLRGWVDHLITLARRGDLHARRQALAIVQEDAVVHKLFADAKERFAAFGKGGYTRIVKLGYRPGDAAPMSLIELMSAPGGTGPSSGKKAKAVKKEAGPAVTAASTVATPAPEPVAEEPETTAAASVEAAEALETPGEAPPAAETFEGEAPRKDAE
jgi:large subunit ribosomal protein L17